MRPLFLILGASLLLASSAGAQEQDRPSAGSDVSQVQVTAPTQPFRFWEYEAEAITGAYAMSNGWRMKINPAQDGIVAQIDRRHPIRLIAQSRSRYVSRDGNVIMEFNRGVDQDEVLMSYVPDDRLAQRIVVTATLAQR
jgi:hypothetical protein